MKKKLSKFFAGVVLAVYFPIYVIGWCSVILSRFFLAISYSITLDFLRAKDIIKSIFDFHGEK